MKTETTDVDVFTTKDFWLAAALMAAGNQLLRLDWRDGRAYFCFREAIRCREDADGYWRGSLNVGARSFADALRTLKDRLHQDENGDGYGNPRNTNPTI